MCGIFSKEVLSKDVSVEYRFSADPYLRDRKCTRLNSSHITISYAFSADPYLSASSSNDSSLSM